MTPLQAQGAEAQGPAVARRGVFERARAGAVALAAGVAGVLGLAGRPVGVAEAGDEWCDTDPLVLDITADGRVVTLFYLAGVKSKGGLLTLVQQMLLGALSSLSASCTARTVSGKTEVEVRVTVPSLSGGPYETRLQVCSGPQCVVGQTYGTASGVSGSPMTVRFTLPPA